MRFLTACLLIPLFTLAQGEDYTWWNNINNWDNVSPWPTYLRLQPGAMGPNALPVQDLRNGSMDSNLNILVVGESHFAPNDFTANLFLKLNIPIKNAVSLQIWWVPFEYYKTDTVVRDFRASRDKDAQGYATGDVYIGTVIPIVRNKEKFPDVLLGVNLKTASGTNLEGARFSDTPGYSFDLSIGKDVWKNKGWTLRSYAMGGFFAYQTFRDDYYQNDAFMWGIGADLKNLKWQFLAELTGYIGYLDELDKPVVGRLQVNRLFQKSALQLRIQQGNNSYPFTSIHFGYKIQLDGK